MKSDGIWKLSDELWKKADELWSAVKSSGESLSGYKYSKIEMDCTNGHVNITGSFKSLKINGYTIRVPEKVTKPK